MNDDVKLRVRRLAADEVSARHKAVSAHLLDFQRRWEKSLHKDALHKDAQALLGALYFCQGKQLPAWLYEALCEYLSEQNQQRAPAGAAHWLMVQSALKETPALKVLEACRLASAKLKGAPGKHSPATVLRDYYAFQKRRRLPRRRKLKSLF